MPLLSDATVKHAECGHKQKKLNDGNGVFVLLHPNGSKYLRYRYQIHGKEKVIALGVYPKVSLATARRKAMEYRSMLEDGKDPAVYIKMKKRKLLLQAANTFEMVAGEWIKNQSTSWTDGHTADVVSSLKNNIFPDLGFRPIKEISTQELLAVLKRVEARGTYETAKRLLQRCRAIFQYGCLIGVCENNPALNLSGVLKVPKPKSYASLKPQELPEFLKKLDNYDGELLTKLALKLLILCMVRTTELIAARWEEIELDGQNPLWRIPETRMKMGREHLVPLSSQAIEILHLLKPLSGNSALIFPCRVNSVKSMSNNTLLYAVYRMGYHKRSTVHGFRSTASTILNEQGWRADVVERQLAHVDRNRIRATYNKAEYLDERISMMQAWADYLDQLNNTKVVNIFSKQIAS